MVFLLLSKMLKTIPQVIINARLTKSFYLCPSLCVVSRALPLILLSLSLYLSASWRAREREQTELSFDLSSRVVTAAPPPVANLIRRFVRWQAAATTCYVAAHPRVAGVTGRYFADCNEALPSPAATSNREAARLWHISEAMIDFWKTSSQHRHDATSIPPLIFLAQAGAADGDGRTS
jgi:hypothetical protein